MQPPRVCGRGIIAKRSDLRVPSGFLFFAGPVIGKRKRRDRRREQRRSCLYEVSSRQHLKFPKYIVNRFDRLYAIDAV